MRPYKTEESKGVQVRTMFDRIAPHYDLLNRVLSLGIDRRWRRKAVDIVSRANPERILDLATGTGDLAVALARKVPGAKITGADISTRMLKIAEAKVMEKGLRERVSFETAEAESLPFGDGTFDCAAIAFGLRNFHDIPRSLDQIRRVLDAGGMLMVLEFSKPRNKIFGALYRFYFHKVLPVAGGLVSRDPEAYRYLPGSVEEFYSPGEFTELLYSHGFTDCRYLSMTNGVAIIYTARKGK